jgi:hypothetical protein
MSRAIGRSLMLTAQTVSQREAFVNHGDESLRIKVGIRDGRKERVTDELPGLTIDRSLENGGRCAIGDAAKDVDQQILIIGRHFRFAAGSKIETAAFNGCFLALIAKHIPGSDSFRYPFKQLRPIPPTPIFNRP